MENRTILIDFKHEGLEAVAAYKVTGVDHAVTANLQDMFFLDSDTPIYPKHVFELDEMETKAVEKYIELEERSSVLY